jgi:hypothetical protein
MGMDMNADERTASALCIDFYGTFVYEVSMTVALKAACRGQEPEFDLDAAELSWFVAVRVER